jgi:hypothetical protein
MKKKVLPKPVSYKQDKTIAIISVIYIVGVSIYMLAHRYWFSPDQFFVFALIGALFLGRTHQFIRDWGPFLFLFFGYEFMRGLVPLVSKNVNILPMIHADKMMFGFVPTIWLQTHLYTPSHLHWYDYLLVTMYICHFITPMIIGYIFWLKDRSFFKEYAIGLLLLSYAGFFTYIAYPAMPPWMASEQGYLPPVQSVTSIVMAHFLPPTIQVPSIYSFMRANPVAAMPSLHAAFPLLIFLFVLKQYGKKGIVFFPYVFGVWFAVMYLGEHYFIDVLVGALYATAAFLFVHKKEFIFNTVDKWKQKLVTNPNAVE